MEQYTHKLAAIYPDQAAADQALDRLKAAGLPEAQLRLISPHDIEKDTQVEPEGDQVPEEFIKDAAVGAGGGAAAGVVGSAAMGITGVAFFVAQPLLATVMTVSYAAAIGSLAGALKGLRIKEDAYVAITKDALRRGHWAVVALGRNEDEEALAHQVFKETTAEQEVGN